MVTLDENLMIDTKAFLSSFKDPSETIYLRSFNDKDKSYAENIETTLASYLSQVPRLKVLNENNNGVFFVVNSGGKKDEQITTITAQFVEMDDLSFEEQLEKINKFPLPPSTIVMTARSLHTYWLMKDAKVEDFRKIQMGLIRWFNGDTKCQNESRCMRLPGFYHCKGEPIMVKCVYFHPELRYTQEQLMEVLDIEEEISLPKSIPNAQPGLNKVISECDFIKHFETDAATLSEHDWYAGITNLLVFKGGIDYIHKTSKNYPTYTVNNTNKKIKHAIDSNTGPITCRVICEKGFKCPKFETGECDCKSPAALSYKPASPKVLKQLLTDAHIAGGDVTEICEKVKTFIDTNMYNVDQIEGEFFINHIIRESFNLKQYDIRVILQYFKKIHSEYDLSEKIIPTGEIKFPWYVPSKSGMSFLPAILADHFGKTELVIFTAEAYHRYDGGVYKKINEKLAKRMIKSKMIPIYCKNNQIEDCNKQWQIVIYKDEKELNPNPYIINLKNGLYNVITNEFTEHDPSYLSTIQLNCTFDKDAKCPKFLQYLDDVMEGDKSQIALIQEMLGYTLIPINLAGRSFLLVGAARAGKSVMLTVINEILLGRENVSNVALQNLNDKFKIAELQGKLANIFADLPTQNITDSGIFKSLVTSDIITVEKKNKDPFSFKSTCKLIFSCNELPRNTSDISEGFFRRLIIIAFNKTIDESKVDINLADKLKEEAPGIFNFALEGLKRLMKNNFKFSETEKNKEELDKYRADSDSALAFFKENCVLEEGSKCYSQTLYSEYVVYCNDSGLKPFSTKKFIGNLKMRYPSIKSGKDEGGVRFLRGIRRINDNCRPIEIVSSNMDELRSKLYNYLSTIDKLYYSENNIANEEDSYNSKNKKDWSYYSDSKLRELELKRERLGYFRILFDASDLNDYLRTGNKEDLKQHNEIYKIGTKDDDTKGAKSNDTKGAGTNTNNTANANTNTNSKSGIEPLTGNNGGVK